MNLVQNEWKDGLPHRALQKITEIEGQRDRLSKETQQKQFRLDTLEQALDKQKRMVEEEKSAQSSLKRENQSLSERCDELERKRQKVEHDLQTKEAHIACLEDQLSSAKNSADAKSSKEHNTHQKRHFETQGSRVTELQTQLKHVQGQLEKQEQAALSQAGGMFVSGFSGGKDAAVNMLQKKLAEVDAKCKKEIEARQAVEAELNILQEKAASDVSNSAKRIEEMKKERSILVNKADNKALSDQSQQINAQKSVQEMQSVTDVHLGQMEKTIDNYKKENEVLKQASAKFEISKFEIRNSKIQEQMSIQLDNKCHEMGRLEAEVKKLKNDVPQADQVNNDLQGKMMDKELEIESLQAQLDRQNNESLNNQNKAQAEVGTLKKDYDIAKDKVERYESDSAQLMKQLNKSSVDMENMHKEFSEEFKEADNSRLTDQNQISQKKIEELTHMLESGRMEQKNLQADDLSEKTKDNEAFKLSNKNLDEKLQDLTRLNHELKHNYDKACEMSDENAKEVKDLIDQLGKKETEIEKHRHQIELQNQTIADLRERTKKLQELESELEHKVIVAEESSEEASSGLSKAQETFNHNKVHLESTLKSVQGEQQTKLDALVWGLCELQVKIGNSESLLELNTKDLDIQRSANKDFDTALQNLKDQLHERSSAHEAVSIKCDELQTQLDDGKAEFEESQAEQKNKFENTLRESAELKEGNLQLHDQKKESKNDMLQLSQQLEKAQKELDSKTEELSDTKTKAANVSQELKARMETLEAEKANIDIDRNEAVFKLESLEEDIEPMTESIELESSKNEQLKQNNKELRSAMETLEAKKSELEQENGLLTGKIAALEVELNQMKDNLTCSSEKSDNLLREMRLHIQQLEILREQGVAAEETINELKSVKQKLEVELEKKEDLVKELSDNLEERKTKSEGRNSESKSKIEDLESKAKTLQTELGDVTFKLESSHAESLGDQVKDLEAKHSQALQQCKEQKEEMSNLIKKLKEVLTEKESLEGKLETAEDTVKELKGDIESSSTKSQSLANEFNEKIAQLKKEREKLKSEIQDAEFKLEGNRKNLDEMTDQITKLTEQNEQATQQCSQLKEAMEKLNEEVKSTEEVKEQIEGQLEKLQDEKSELEKNLTVYKSKAEDLSGDLRQRIKSGESDTTSLKEELTKKLSERQSEVEQLQQGTEKAAVSKESLKQQCTISKEKVKELNTNIQVLRDENATMAQRISDLESQLNETSANAEKLKVTNKGLKEAEAEKEDLCKKLETLEKNGEESRETSEETISKLEALELQTKLKNGEGEKESLKRELNDVNFKLKNMSEDIDSVSSQQEEVSDGLNKLQNAHKTMEDEYQELKIKFDEEEISSLQLKEGTDELQNVCNLLQSRDQELTESRGREVLLQDNIKSAQMHSEKLQSKCDDSSQTKVDKWEQNVIQLHSDKESLVSKVEELEAEKRQLNDNITSLKETKSGLECRISELESTHKTVEDEKCKLEDEMKRLKEEHSTLSYKLTNTQLQGLETKKQRWLDGVKKQRWLDGVQSIQSTCDLLRNEIQESKHQIISIRAKQEGN